MNKSYLLFSALIFFSSISQAQIDYLNHQESYQILQQKFDYAKKNNLAQKPISEIFTSIAKSFIGTDYEGFVLEKPETEAVFLYLTGLDCVSLVENSLVISRMIKLKKYSKEDFLKELEFIRYRNGKMSDYHSRLHYFSDWIFENEKKGVLKNLSKKLGGEAKLTQKISFMSNHKELYPRLKTDNDVTKIKTIEDSLNRREIFYISKGQILNTNAKPNLKLENILKDGDIIALVSSDETLDITHVTIAVKQKNKFHLLHAPKPNTKVQITEKSFEEYLRSSKGVQGFMVVRLVEPS